MKCLHIMRRTDAVSIGRRFYVSHKLCVRGHFSERQVSDKSCTECKKLRVIENAEDVKSYRAAYNEAHRERINTRQRAYYADNQESEVSKKRTFRIENPEKIKEAALRHRTKHADKISLAKKEEYRRNPAPAICAEQRRRAIKMAAEGSFTAAEVRDLFQKQKGKCAICSKALEKTGGSKFHADHIQPLSRGGSNWISNIQLACKKCNLSKGAKDPMAFAKEKGKLL